jgi:hypothetical protein
VNFSGNKLQSADARRLQTEILASSLFWGSPNREIHTKERENQGFARVSPILRKGKTFP